MIRIQRDTDHIISKIKLFYVATWSKGVIDLIIDCKEKHPDGQDVQNLQIGKLRPACRRSEESDFTLRFEMQDSSLSMQ